MHGSENVKFFKLRTVYDSEIALILFLKLLKCYSVAYENVSFSPFKFCSNFCVWMKMYCIKTTILNRYDLFKIRFQDFSVGMEGNL